MKNTKEIILKLPVVFLIGFIAFVFLPISVRAEMETDTAGSSLGKEVVDNGERANYTSVKTRAVQGWIQDSTGWWYQYSDGSYPVSSWRKIDGSWYYFNSNGYWVDNNIHEQGSIKGIDVSAWQGSIDWQAVKDDGIQFAFIRVGHGTHELDTYYKDNMKQANEVNLPVGVYYYSTAQTEEAAVADAQFVIKNITGYKVSYPVVIDLEDSSQTSLSKGQIGRIAKAFCDVIRAAGYTPMLYCNENWYNNYIDVSQISDVDKWVARYGVTYSTSIPRTIWQCCCTGRVNGINGNVDIDFGYKDYTTVIIPRTEPLSSYHFEKGQWKQDDTGWWYSYYAGGYPANKWEKIQGNWYWFDAKGYRVAGWKNISGVWYYFDEEGIMLTGWQQIGDEWYYFDGSGAMKTGWQYLGNAWYYLKSSGEMVSGWQTIEGYRYYFDESGVMYSGTREVDGRMYNFGSGGGIKIGWIAQNGNWYYIDESIEYHKGFLTVDGATYYMDASGVMRIGWQLVDNIWYYFSSSGAMRIGWQYINNVWYYLGIDGKMVTDFQMVGNDMYYFTTSGAMVTGWQLIDGTWYYFSSSGSMRIGWQYINNIWYYLGTDGKMVTGFQVVGNDTYYFTASGAMAVGWQLIGNEWYYFGGNGSMQKNKWIGNYYVGEDGIMQRNCWIGEYYVGSDGLWIPNALK